MNKEVIQIIQDRLDEEVNELRFLKYRESLGWKNKIPLFGLPMSMELIKERLQDQEKEVQRIKLLLNDVKEREEVKK